MKKALFIFLLIAVLAVTVFIFRDPIIDFLPIDQSGWVERDGNRYLLDADGDPQTGWYGDGNSRYYFREDGAMHTGWLETAEGRYYFDNNGHLHTGWLEKDGQSHYFGADGLLYSGLLEQNGKRFYLNENGSPVTGWQQAGEAICFVTKEGTIPTGWLQIDNQKYYLTERGFRYCGWLDMGASRYYFHEDGTLATGWLTLDSGSYYMGADGVMAVGWTDIDGTLRYFDESGKPYSGWLTEGDQRRYLDAEGVPLTGWLEEDGKKYYLLEDGTPAVGRLEIEGETYFFTSAGVSFILVNPWNSLPKDFHLEPVEASGAWLDPVCRDALERMLADCRAAGYSPRIVSSYRSVADQRVNLQNMINSLGGNYAAAIQIVAVPGTSEHHLGLAFDIVDSTYPKLNHQQADMPAQKWLMEHCWEYGFILRYPENTTDITGIIWEPWHYRYVGTELSLEIRELGCITLEEYIDNLTADGTTCGGRQPTE